MLHVGLDLSRRRLDYLALTEDGNRAEVGAAPPDADGLRGLAVRMTSHGEPIHAAIESMNGARFVHDTLERSGWEVEIADAQKVKGLAPLACKTDRIDAWVLAEFSRLDLVPAIWLPDPAVRAERERARWRLYLVRQRVRLKQRVHSRPARLSVRRVGPPRRALKARPALPALGADRGGARRLQAPALPPPLRAHQAPARSPARPRVAQVELARGLAHSIWHMLTRGETFAAKGASVALAA